MAAVTVLASPAAEWKPTSTPSLVFRTASVLAPV